MVFYLKFQGHTRCFYAKAALLQVSLHLYLFLTYKKSCQQHNTGESVLKISWHKVAAHQPKAFGSA